MADNPYPAWKQQACVHCAAGIPMYWFRLQYGSAPRGFHDDGSDNPPNCTAPTEAERIAELETQLAFLLKAGFEEVVDGR